MTARPPIKVNLKARAANAELRRASTRAKLLETIAAVIAEKGPKPPSVEEIASAAGLSRGTFYNYFDSPEALVDALRLEFARVADKRLDEALSVTDDAAIQLALMARYFFEFAARSPVQAAAFLHVEEIEGSRRPFANEAFEAVIRHGVASGRFRKVDARAARALTFGAGRMVMRDMLQGVATPGQGKRVVTLALLALGLNEAEAELICATTLDGVDALSA